MDIVFYSIDSKQYEVLESKVNNYNKVIKELFNKDAVNRIKLIKERSQIEKEIMNSIKEYEIVSTLSEDEFESINKEFKDKYLNTNFLTQNEIESMYMEVEEKEDIKYNKLLQVLKKALKNKKMLFFWIR